MQGVRLLAEAREADPSAFRRVEPDLVDAARNGTVQELKREASRFVRQTQERGGDRMAMLRGKRRLSAALRLSGMVQSKGT